MRVGSLYIGNAMQDTSNLELNHQLKKTFHNLIILNSEARMEMSDDDTPKFVPTGSPVEVGLLRFLVDDEVPVHEELVNRERNYVLKTMIPFSSQRKRMTVAYQLPETDGTVRVVVKGAPEYIVPLCTKELDQNDDPQDFEGDGDPGKNYLIANVADQIASLG
jgi:magnesium-transporting ATPase (P-type)